jgi:serine/threonine protein kinase
LQMSTGYPPWKSMKFGSISALMYHVANTNDPPPMPETVSPALRAFLVQCFQRNPDKRPGADGLMQHDFVVGVSQDFADMTVGNHNSVNISQAIDTRSQRSSSGTGGAAGRGGARFSANDGDDAIQFDEGGALGTGEVLGTLSLSSDGDALSPMRSPPGGKFEPVEPFDIGSFSMKGELPSRGGNPAPEETIREHLSELGRRAERLADGVRDGAAMSAASAVGSPPIGDPSANPFSRVNSTIADEGGETTIGDPGSQSNNNPQENSLTVKDGDAAAAAAMEASYIAVVERPITTDTALRNAEQVREAEEKRKRLEAEKKSQWERELEMERQLQRSMRQST